MKINYKLALYDFLAGFFILSAPYLSFATHQGLVFQYASLFILACIALIAGVAVVLLRLLPFSIVRVLFYSVLLLYFIDFQFEWFTWWGNRILVTVLVVTVAGWVLRGHLSEILSVVFGVMIAGILAGSLLGQFENKPLDAKREAAPENDLPVYVHLILDEHIGLSALDEDAANQKAVKEEIEAIFSKYGFRLYGRAFSHYFNSNDSIATMLNFSASDSPEQWYVQGRLAYKYELLKNAYFDEILSAGYRINVYQSKYMDFCEVAGSKAAAKCLTYNFDGISRALFEGLRLEEQVSLLLPMYGGLSFFLEDARKRYLSSGNEGGDFGLGGHDWFTWDKHVGPIPVMPVFDELIEDLASARRGTMYFAHLLIPHSPYSLDAQCNIRRPALSWQGRTATEADEPSYRSNTVESRKQSYDHYLPQIRCALLKFDELLRVMQVRGVLDDATIVVHGDHGSRIVLVEPRAQSEAFMTTQDFYDAFSTLYAVKSPVIPAGYDDNMQGLPSLLESTVRGVVPGSGSTGALPRVFLRSRKDGGPYVEALMPELPPRLN